MSDYEVTCENGEYNDLVWVEKFAKTASKMLKNWTEIRFDEDGKCFAYTHKPHRETSWWVARDGKSWYVTHHDGFDFIGSGIDWQTFGIIRTPEAKPKRGKKGKKSQLIKLLARYAAELSSELSATRAMLTESQRELEEANQRQQWARKYWENDGWDSGASAMLKAALSAEALIIHDVNNGAMNTDGAVSAGRVVGALQNEFGRGMLTGE